eukprot:scpid52019/ scgid9984/ Protein Wnt-11b-2
MSHSTMRSWYPVSEVRFLLLASSVALAALLQLQLLFVATVTAAPPGQWWMYGSSQSVRTLREQCSEWNSSSLPDDIASQLICPLSERTVEEIEKSAYQAVWQCRVAFAKHRWNCPNTTLPFLSRKATRESAYLNALMAAALASGISHACHRGTAAVPCSCLAVHEDRKAEADGERDNSTVAAMQDDARVQRWLNGKCNDNIAHARKFSQDFMDRQVDTSKKNGVFALYNYKVGREVFNSRVKKKCKSYGVSGSSTLHTCWWQEPSIEEISAELYHRYGNAIKTKMHFLPTKRRQSKTLTFRQKIRSPRPGQLAYLRSSPDYCTADASRGIPGTRGRRCERTFSTEVGSGSCYNLCCGGGSHAETVEETVCDCQIIYCCYRVCTKNCRTVRRTIRKCNQF